MFKIPKIEYLKERHKDSGGNGKTTKKCKKIGTVNISSYCNYARLSSGAPGLVDRVFAVHTKHNEDGCMAPGVLGHGSVLLSHSGEHRYKNWTTHTLCKACSFWSIAVIRLVRFGPYR